MSKDSIVTKEVKELAEAHANYIVGLVRRTYMDAFIHGYKHGVVSATCNDKGVKHG